MAVYDEEDIRNREEAAGNSAPSSDGNPSKSGNTESSKGGESAEQLRQKEIASAFPNITNSLAKGGGVPAFSFAGVGGAALKMLGRSLWGSNKRKAATLGGSSGVMVILGVIWIANFSTGPFAFIHLSEILSKHFDPTTRQTEKRMGRILFQEVFDPPEDVKNPIGDNRLSFLGYLMKNKTLNDLNKAGFKPMLKEDGFSFDGFSIDPTNKNSPYNKDYDAFLGKAEGADEAAALRDLSAYILKHTDPATGNSVGLDPTGKLALRATVENGKIVIRGKQTLFSDTGIKAMSDTLVSGDHPFFDPIWDFVRVRNLSRWTISGNLHFLSRLDAKVTSAKDAWLKAKIYDPIKSKLGGTTSDGVAVEGKDKNGNPTETPLDGGQGPVTETTAKGFLSDPKGFASVAGGVAAAAAIICILRSINQAVGIIRYGQILWPMISMYFPVQSIGSQIKSGQDISMVGLDALGDSKFNTYDKNGNVTDTWYDSMPLRATAGDTGGTDVNKGVKDLLHDKDVPWLEWTNSDPVRALCSTGAQVALTAISIGLLLVPGVDVISAALGVVVFGAAATIFTNVMTGILAGQGIDLNATGAAWGGDLDYGARGAANAHALQYGGVAVSQQEENQQVAEANARDRAAFQSESFADRVFNPSNYQSVVGSMIDRAGVYSFQDLAAKVGNIPNILGSLFSLPASIVSASAHADSTYQYPFPMIGFSDADINDPIVNAPFDNADQVSAILDAEASSGDHTYIDKALNCFGVAISKGDQGWDAVPTSAPSTNGDDHTLGVNPYDPSHYDEFNCTDAGNTDWKRIRIWILDLAVMEGYACTKGDQTSCENSGFAPASSSGTTVNGVKFFSQNDPRWANITMWDGDTIGSEGCVLAAEAMVINTLASSDARGGKDVTPVELDQKYGSDNDPYDHYGLHSTGLWRGEQLEATPENLQRVITAVKGGAVVVMYASWDNVEPFWGTSGHAEVIRGIAPDGNLLVYDPWDMPDSSNAYVPDPKYPNDAAQHGAKEWPQQNFLNDYIKTNSRHSDRADLRFDIITK